MRDAASNAIEFVRGRDRTELWTDRLLAYGLVKCIEIIGEAANKVVNPKRSSVGTICWTLGGLTLK